MRGKRKIAILAATVSAVTCLCLGVACSKVEYSSSYEASYGEWFVLPTADEITVKDSDGNIVEIEDGKIFITDMEGYTIIFKNDGKESESSVTVTAGNSPVIHVEKRMSYATIGELTELVEATATDGVSNVEVVGKMYKDGNEVDITNGFVPSEVGAFDYVLTATGGNGKTSTFTVPYYVEASYEAYENKITSFDKPFGVNQIANRTGLTSYSTDVKFEGEDGSTAIEMSGAYTDLSSNCLVVNLNQADVTGYDGFYFYVYNGTGADITVWYSWGKSYLARSGEWTRMELLQKEFYRAFIGAGPDVQKEDMTLENINGFNLNFAYSKDAYIRRGECLYFSAAYGLKQKTLYEVQDIVDNLTSLDSTSQLALDDMEFYYERLSSSQRNAINGYTELKDLRLKREVQNNSYDYVENKLGYFDNELALRQVSNGFGAASFTVSNAKTYNNEATLGVTVQTVESGYRDLAVKIDKSYRYDLSAFDILEVAIYNPTDVDLLYWNTNGDYKGLSSTNYVLKAQSWTHVAIPVTDGDAVEGRYLWVRPSAWDDVSAVMSGETFYFAPIYAYSYADRLQTVINAGDYSDELYMQSLIAAYNSLDDSVKTESQSLYGQLVNQITGLSVGDVAINFNADGIDATVSDTARTEYSYCTDSSLLTALQTAEGTSETKAGVACYELVGDGVSSTTDYYNLVIANSEIEFFSGLETLEMWVYIESDCSTVGYMYRNGGWSDSNAYNGSQTTLQANTWTKITLSLRGENSLNDWILIISSGSSGWGAMNEGDKVYLSALTVASIPG